MRRNEEGRRGGQPEAFGVAAICGRAKGVAGEIPFSGTLLHFFFVGGVLFRVA